MGVQVPPRTRQLTKADNARRVVRSVKRRVTDEAYYTSRDIARSCVTRLGECVALDEFDLIVEPSAGNGSFLAFLPERTTVALDITPGAPDILQRDFLTWQPPNNARRILVIGNPPFGQRAAIASRFVAHAAHFAHVIAFILPRSFNKETFQTRIPPLFHLADALNLDGPFHCGGAHAYVKTTFQIWVRADTPRMQIVRPRSHPDFAMRHAHLSRVSPEVLAQLKATHDFVIPQVGSKFHPRDVFDVHRGSQWFIKELSPGVRTTFEAADFSFLADMNTAHTSLSRADIVQAYCAAKAA